jgi:WD40 repeat protein
MQGSNLSDGFEEVFNLKHHHSEVKGLKVVEVMEENAYIQDRKDTYVSWDIGGVALWERPHAGHRATPKVTRQVRFPKTSPGFITSIVYVKQLSLFVAAALDMSFKLYNRRLELIETISHEERAILAMEYDESRRIIVMAGATGVTMWRLYRTTTVSMEYVIERVYKFDASLAGLWISRISLDQNASGQVYAFSDKSVYVLDLDKRKCIYHLENIHESTLTSICWYERSQFYMTGCLGGKIKCWTALHWKKKAGRFSKKQQERSANVESSNTLSLLHTFNVHTAAIAGVILHPVSGMGVSASMDGTMHVLNLEMFTVIYTINLHGIGVRSLMRINLKPEGKMGVLFEDENHTIHLWKFASVAGFFGIATDAITSLEKFENMQEERLQGIAAEIELAAERSATAVKADFFKIKEEEESSRVREQQEVGRRTAIAVSTAAAFSHNAVSFEMDMSKVKSSEFASGEGAGDENGKQALLASMRRQSTAVQNRATATVAANSGVGNQPYNASAYVVARAGRDLRLFTERGRPISCMDPDVVTDGIKCYTVSVYQQLLFCLFDSGALKVFCMRSGSVTGEWSELIKEYSKWNLGVGETERATCMTLVDSLPLAALKPPISDTHRFAKDLRGLPVPEHVNELIAVGTQTGLVCFLDTMNDCKAAHVMQGRQGASDSDSIEAIAYRYRRSELFTTGRSPCGNYYSIRVWHLPEISLVCEVLRVPLVSPHPNAFAVSHKLPYFGVGCSDGDVRIYMVMNAGSADATSNQSGNATAVDVESDEVPRMRGHSSGQMEVMFRSGDLHTAPVTALDFCDALRVYASCSADQQVKLWTCEKQILRTIQYNMPTTSLCFNDGLNPGDCIFSQVSYLLNIKKDFWDAGDILQGIRDHVEVWVDKGLGAGLFRADDVHAPSQKHALRFSELTPRNDDGHATGSSRIGISSASNKMNTRSSAVPGSAATITDDNGGGKILPVEEGVLSAYYLRKENKSAGAVAARQKLADERVKKVATPWRSQCRIGSSKSRGAINYSKRSATSSDNSKHPPVAPSEDDEHDWGSDDGSTYWNEPEDEDFEPINTSAGRAVRPSKHALLVDHSLDADGSTHQQLPPPLQDRSQYRPPSPRSIHFGFAPEDPMQMYQRGFTQTPETSVRFTGNGDGGCSSSSSLEGATPFEKMRRLSMLGGLGARGAAMLLANPSDTTTPTTTSEVGPVGPVEPSATPVHSSVPNHRGRVIRATSPINVHGSSERESSRSSSGVAATRVPKAFKEAKLRDKMSKDSRDSVLRISNKALNVHSLADDRLEALESHLSSAGKP